MTINTEVQIIDDYIEQAMQDIQRAKAKLWSMLHTHEQATAISAAAADHTAAPHLDEKYKGAVTAEDVALLKYCLTHSVAATRVVDAMWNEITKLRDKVAK